MRQSKGKVRVKPHKIRPYKGTSQKSITTKKLTKASFYTHIMDNDSHSPTFGQRIERIDAS